MAEATALGFLLLGVAVVAAATGQAWRTVQALCLSTCGIATVTLTGYLYDVRSLWAVGPFTGIALPTAVAFFAASAGLLAADPSHGVAGLLASDTVGGFMTRRVLPFSIGIPLVCGWLAVRGEVAGLYAGRFGDALLAVVCMVFAAGVIVWQGGALARIDEARRRATDETERAGRYARSLIEASLDPLVTISPDGSVSDVNEATVAATGVSRDGLVGSRFSDYFTEPDRAEAGYKLVLAQGEVRDYALTLRHVSGRTIHVVYNATVYRDEAGAVQGVFAAARDVTEQRRAEEEVRRSNRELEQFAYVASHDLQEPLRMVSSFTQLLAQRYRDKLDADANEFIGYAVDGATRMQRMINDLLTYSRVATRGKSPAPADAGAALGEALTNLRATIELTGAVVTHGDLPVVLADETQLVQVFQNLVGNAVKFHRAGESPRVHVSARREGGFWRFEVKDDGIGVAKEFVPKLFTVFQRLHTAAEYPGTGIGLAICKRVVERLGGRIGLESSPGSGSTFFFTLPGAEGTMA